ARILDEVVSPGAVRRSVALSRAGQARASLRQAAHRGGFGGGPGAVHGGAEGSAARTHAREPGLLPEVAGSGDSLARARKALMIAGQAISLSHRLDFTRPGILP